ncbi:hypothetical protein CASFOL_028594 [Castilleja foliolosa]|uniref:Uncharacterized protein n=1 Tax=Castilleja foliolosa TaxID=1961234 RepID=A0ABD3CBN2_9LAMI
MAHKYTHTIQKNTNKYILQGLQNKVTTILFHFLFLPKMEPINANPDNSEAQVIDDNLDKIVQDFTEFRDKISQTTSSNDMKLEDIIDLYINNSCENPYDESLTDQSQFTDLLLSAPPPHQVTSPQKQHNETNGYNMDSETQETQNVNVNDGNVTYIRYGDLNYDGAAGDFIGRVFGCDMNFWWRGLCATTGGKKVKRKYRGDIESEEETARREDRTRLNNKESANKTLAYRKEM